MSTSDATHGQVVADAAEVYERFFVPALFEQWADPILDQVGLRPGDDVADIGCGTGVVARRAATRLGSSGSVVGVDRNDAMLAVARRVAPAIAWRRDVAEALAIADGTVDRVVCAFALMFFDDRRAAVGEMARVLRPGGSAAVATWADLDESPGYAAMVELLDRVVGRDAADALRVPFGLGSADEVRDLMGVAFGEVAVARHEGVARFDSIEAWVHTDIRGWTLAGSIDDDTYRRLVAEASSVLARFVGPDGHVAFPAPALIAVGRAPRSRAVPTPARP